MASTSSKIVFGLGTAALITGLLLIAKGLDQGTLRPQSATDIPPVLSGDLPEAAIVNAVKRAEPAVVSVIVTKDLPVFRYIRDDSNPFSQFFPQRVQDGTQRREIGGGTAFFVSEDGLLLTNKHVVDDTSAQYTVLLNDGRQLPVTIAAQDPTNDIALLKVDGDDFPYLTLQESDEISLGQTAIAIGNALAEFRNTVSVGVISGLQRSIIATNAGTRQTEQLESIVQTDAAINAGNSGGPLLSSRGEVIGMNTAVASVGQNIGFALPVSQLRRVLESYEEFGRIVRPFIGVRYAVITPDIQKANDLSVDDGLLITQGETPADLAIVPGSPAEKVGLKQGDIILSVDGEPVGRSRSLSSIVQRHMPGDVLTVIILRGNDRQTVSVTLEELKE